MGPLYYDRDGSPLDLAEWARRFEDTDYRRVDRTVLPNGYEVSTVWLGVDHNWGGVRPHIFETMVFPEGPSNQEAWQERYATLEEAKAGHRAAVEKWAKEKH